MRRLPYRAALARQAYRFLFPPGRAGGKSWKKKKMLVWPFCFQKITKKQGLFKIVAPFLIFSLLFGTVVPNIVGYLVLDHQDLHTVLISSDIDFISVSIAFGLMITSLLMPFITLYQ